MHRSSARHRAGVISADERAVPAVAVRLARLLERVLRAAIAGIEAAAFWLAALFPLAYLPLLVALQYAALDPMVVARIGIVNLLALVVGHRHDPTQSTHDTPDPSKQSMESPG